MTGGPPRRPGIGPDHASGDRLAALQAEVRPARTITGWGTIDLDRLATGDDGLPDPHLGARTRPIDDDRIALEPSTEGLLAASLARLGEGPVAVYLVGGHQPAGITTSTEADGPFGRQRLVLGGPRWGPHVLLVSAVESPAEAEEHPPLPSGP